MLPSLPFSLHRKNIVLISTHRTEVPLSNTEASFERGPEHSCLDAGQTYPRPRPTSPHTANRTASPWPQHPPKKPGRGFPAGAQPYLRHPNPGFPMVNLVLIRRRCTLEGVAALQVHGLGTPCGRVSGPGASWPGTYSSSPAQTHHLPEPLKLKPICLSLAGSASVSVSAAADPVSPHWVREG